MADQELEERRRDEKEVLESMYADDVEFSDDLMRCSIRMRSVEGRVSCVLRCHLSETYPNDDALRAFEIEGLHESADSFIVDALVHDLEEASKHTIGEILFEWSTIVQNHLDHADEMKTEEQKAEQAKLEEQVAMENALIESLEELEVQQQTPGSSELDTLVQSWHSGSPFTDRKSTFQAHIAQAATTDDVDRLMKALLTNNKIARATHNISAYRLEWKDDKGNFKGFIQDNDDDGESQAGKRVAHLLEMLDVRNAVVVVSRWYGGIHLGPDRFKHINNLAREIVTEAPFTCTGDKNSGGGKHNK